MSRMSGLSFDLILLVVESGRFGLFLFSVVMMMAMFLESLVIQIHIALEGNFSILVNRSFLFMLRRRFLLFFT